MPRAHESAKAFLDVLGVLYVAQTKSEDVPENDVQGRVIDYKRFATDLKGAEVMIAPFVKSKNQSIAKPAGLIGFILNDMQKTMNELARLLVLASAGHVQDDVKFQDNWTDKRARLDTDWSSLSQTLAAGTYGMLQEPKSKHDHYTAYDFTEGQRDKLVHDLLNEWGDEVKMVADSNVRAAWREIKIR